MNRLLILGICISIYVGFGQKIGFTGYGRAQILNDRISGNALDDDTISANRATDGDMVFDLGMYFHPYEYFRAKTLVRLKNKFGVFFGQGASVDFRQILIEGLVGHKIRYEIGDIDISGTPFTVHNHEDTSLYESEIFKMRREIVRYENFNNGSSWRMQGVQVHSLMGIKNTPIQIKGVGFATRTRPTNYNDKPDRFFVGTSLNGDLSNGLQLGGNLVSYMIFPKQFDSASFYNTVYTGSLKYNRSIQNVVLGFELEAGKSSVDKALKGKNIYHLSGGVLQSGFSVFFKKVGLSMSVTYRSVAEGFISSASQNQRVDVEKKNVVFPLLDQNNTQRAQNVFDRLTDATIVNTSFDPNLKLYMPQFNNVTPYGVATPNRRGIELKLDWAAPNKYLKVSSTLSRLGEIKADSLTETREFSELNTCADLNVGKILKSRRILNIGVAFKNQQTDRLGFKSIGLKSNMFDLGLVAEVFSNLDLMLGLKNLAADGNEYIKTRNVLLQYQNEVVFDKKIRQNVLSLGLRYRFANNTFFNVSFNNVRYRDFGDHHNDYQMQQFYTTYILQF